MFHDNHHKKSHDGCIHVFTKFCCGVEDLANCLYELSCGVAPLKPNNKKPTQKQRKKGHKNNGLDVEH